MDINKLIEKHEATVLYRKRMFDRYTTESIPIKTEKNPAYLQKQIEDNCQRDRRIYNHFEKEIVDTKVSYFAGHPVIVTSFDGDENLNHVVDMLNITIDYEDLFAELTKDSAIAGVGAVLLYKDKDANVNSINLKPYEFSVFYSFKNPYLAIRKYQTRDEQGELTDVVDLYDEDYITQYEKVNGAWVQKLQEMHGFSDIPLVEVFNNAEKQSDFHSVIDLIDAYNRLITDFQNEVEAFRLAYLVLENYSVTEEDLKMIRESGAISIDGEGKVSFLTKNIDSTAIEILRNILEKNIARFSSHVEFNSSEFTGNLTRVAVKYKIMKLEQKTLNFERKFKAFLRRFYKVYFSFKGFTKTMFDYKNLTFGFTRNLPVNLLEEAEFLNKLGAKVSKQTALSLVSFIDNPEDEFQKIESEKGDNDETTDSTEETEETENTQ